MGRRLTTLLQKVTSITFISNIVTPCRRDFLPHFFVATLLLPSPRTRVCNSNLLGAVSLRSVPCDVPLLLRCCTAWSCVPAADNDVQVHHCKFLFKCFALSALCVSPMLMLFGRTCLQIVLTMVPFYLFLFKPFCLFRPVTSLLFRWYCWRNDTRSYTVHGRMCNLNYFNTRVSGKMSDGYMLQLLCQNIIPSAFVPGMYRTLISKTKSICSYLGQLGQTIDSRVTIEIRQGR